MTDEISLIPSGDVPQSASMADDDFLLVSVAGEARRVSKATLSTFLNLPTGFDPRVFLDFDASAGSFPSGALRGDGYVVTTAGTIDGQAFTVGDYIVAKIDDPSTTTYAGNWERYTDAAGFNELRSDVDALQNLTFPDIAALQASDTMPDDTVSTVAGRPYLRDAAATDVVGTNNSFHDLGKRSAAAAQYWTAQPTGVIFELDGVQHITDNSTGDASAFFDLGVDGASMLGPRSLKDADTVLADTLPYMVAGTIVRAAAEGYSYTVADAAATDHDLESAGGVKLRVNAINGDYPAAAFYTLQNALDAVQFTTFGGNGVSTNGGDLNVTEPLKIPKKTNLKLEGTNLRSSAVRAIEIGWDETGTSRPSNAMVTGGHIELLTAGAVGVAIENAYAPRIYGTDINMRADGQIGVHLRGEHNPPGSYYGDLQDMWIQGVSPRGTKVGVLTEFDEGSGDPTASGFAVQRWGSMSFRQIAVQNIGMDIQACRGLTVSAVNLESIDTAGIRLGHRPAADYSGTVTVGGSVSKIEDSAWDKDIHPSSLSVVITSGANSGESRAVRLSSDGELLLAQSLPFAMAASDTFDVYYIRANGFQASRVGFENGATDTAPVVDFSYGARACRVEPYFHTSSGLAPYFTRKIADRSNVFGFPAGEIVMQGVVPSGTANFDFAELGTISQAFGGTYPDRAVWIDSMDITGFRRSVGAPGEITAQVKVGGVDRAGVSATLTSDNPRTGYFTEMGPAAADLIQPHQNIRVRASSAGTTQQEEVKVTIRLRSF